MGLCRIIFLVFIWHFSYINLFGQNSQDIIDVSSNKQLFIDDMLVESSQGITRTMNKPVQYDQVLLTNDQPWESGQTKYVAVYCSALKDQGKIKLWYDLYDKDTQNRYVAYAESVDGINFTKPILNRIDINGSKANNFVLPTTIGGCSVWIDPQAAPDERFKTQAKVYPSGELHIHSSPNGLDWKLFATPKIGDKDTQSIIFWDNAVSRYVMYTRKWTRFENKDANFRSVRRLESDDLANWDNELIVFEPDSVDRALYKTPTQQPPVDYYGALVFKYPETNGMYLMLAQAFWHWFDRTPLNRLGPNTFDVRLACSRDGKKFTRVERKPFLKLGPNGSFYSKMIWALPHPIQMDDELWFYFAGSNKDHAGHLQAGEKDLKSGIGRAVLRLDGFVSLDTDYQGGELITPLITFKGKSLELNLQTSGGGAAFVEILDKNNRPIKGYSREDALPLNGNSVRIPVKWRQNHDVSELSGKAVKLRIFMKECKLFAFQFRE